MMKCCRQWHLAPSLYASCICKLASTSTLPVLLGVFLVSKLVVLLEYLKREMIALPNKQTCLSLIDKEIKLANKHMKDVAYNMNLMTKTQTTRGKYNYAREQRAQIGKHVAENSPTRATKHFSEVLNREVPELRARRLKAEYLRCANFKMSKVMRIHFLSYKVYPLKLREDQCQMLIKLCKITYRS